MIVYVDVFGSGAHDFSGVEYKRGAIVGVYGNGTEVNLEIFAEA